MKHTAYYPIYILLFLLILIPATNAGQQEKSNNASQVSGQCAHGDKEACVSKIGCCWVKAHFPNDLENLRKHLKGRESECCWGPGHDVQKWGKHNCSFCSHGLHQESWHETQKGRTSYCCGADEMHHWSWHIHSLWDKSDCPLCKSKKHGKSWHDSLDWKCDKWGWQKDGTFHCCWDQHKLWDPENCELCKNKIHEPSWHKSLNLHCKWVGDYTGKPSDDAKSVECPYAKGDGKGKSGDHKCGGCDK